MNFSRFFYHMPSLVLSVFLLVTGVLALGLAWSPVVRTETITFILEQRWALFSIALILLIGGVTLIAYVIKESRRRYLYVTTGQNACLLDESFIEQYLNVYWKQLFPTQDISYELNIKKNKIKIYAHFPPFPLDEQKRFLEKQRRELSNIFSRLIGYPHDIILGASFKSDV
jgi:hypothetical protein